MKKILVIGDSCRDVFVYCDAQRLCPDVPVPVLNIVDQTENPGMAKNVQRNISALQMASDCITNLNWHDLTKTRYVHRKTNHMFVRVDSRNSVERINLSAVNYNYDAIIISDYNKGFLHEDDIETICKNHSLVFVDTKKTLGPWLNHAKFIKINDVEYRNSIHVIDHTLSKKIIRTTGENGCVYNGTVFPVDKVEVQDVSGAGDTFIASLVVDYVQTSSIESAIRFANKCASEVVKHRGVTVPRDIK